MRRFLNILLSAFLGATALGQSSSPEALYQRGINAITGMGPTRNDQEGFDYFRRSAQMGYGPAELALGYYYETGTFIAGDPSQARDLYRKAAIQGDPLAGWIVGRHYYVGNGAPQDLDAAIKWLKVGAAQKNAYAAYLLGRIMADRDFTQAPPLYKIAAEQGLPQAQYFYARALKEGRGVPQDHFSAYIWFLIALDAHYTVAGTDLSQIRSSGHLTLAQLNEAENRAHELEQVVTRAANSRGCAGWDGEFDELPTPPPPTLHPYCH
jgi:uncharacterized protein